jgi:hypothetical protein
VCFALVVQLALVRTRRALAMVGVTLAAALLVPLPWYVHQQRAHGSPLAFSRPAPDEPLIGRRPASFYVDFDVHGVFTAPYVPNFRNQLLPTVYSDWWGDYWRYFEVPMDMINEPATLPHEYARPRVLQSYVGIVPSVLMLAGFIALVVAGIRGRSPSFLAVPATLVALACAYLLFQTAYPHPDGDTIKSPYLLDAVAPLALCAAWSVTWLATRSRLVLAAVALVFVDLLFLDLRFLVL